MYIANAMFTHFKKRLWETEPFLKTWQILNLQGQSTSGNIPKIEISRIYGSLKAFLTEYIFLKGRKKILFIGREEETLHSIQEDLHILGIGEKTAMFSEGKISGNNEIAKAMTLMSGENEYIVFVTEEKSKENVIAREEFAGTIIELKSGGEYLYEELLEKLEEYGFEKKYMVEMPGDYAVRGGIVDIYPENFYSPIRLEFFGETIESIREFDINTQRSVNNLEIIKIGKLPAKNGQENQNNSTIFDYTDKETLFIKESDLPGSLIISGNRFSDENEGNTDGIQQIEFNSAKQPDFRGDVKQLITNINGLFQSGNDVFITCSDKYQSERLKTLIGEVAEEYGELSAEIKYFNNSVDSGFIFSEAKLAVYTEHQIFGRYFRQTGKKKKKYKSISIDELKQLKTGDYVVHRDFGIGVFAGMVTRTLQSGNAKQDFVKILYANNDTIFVGLNYINLISKYTATEGYTPKLTRLGGGEWETIKARTKKKVQDIAKELIVLYAKRKSLEGIAFQPDTHWERELEANFMYEDTPDQSRAVMEVKEDMQSGSPMDRLVCGDVGFGKTEVAIRAAFKAVLGGKQVAVLVPTTILAIQHYNTFRDRLAPFAVETGCVTRFNTKKEQKETLEKLENGKLDILIGTHRLFSKDVKFKDLGLLVIDEEHRFGVKHKEKLRSLKPNVDTLTLTATPIPRTLNFSMLGARDLSIINTPPKNRKPIITEIIRLNWQQITSIINKEISRGGQIYFVNDKVTTIYKIADKLKELMPLVRIDVAHGQMDKDGREMEIMRTGKTHSELEDVIIDFIEKKIDVLVCTKIIESGLDIPNVNTIIINNANMFGLAELYQLRGRVGRSDKQAYAYFISPPVATLTKSALMRLEAIEEYSELGSGFNLSMRDMEIRGVGNLLGREQSGFVQQVGFELYMDIINEAVAEIGTMKHTKTAATEPAEDVKEKLRKSGFVFENDLNAYIPETYIEDNNERMNIYKELYSKIEEPAIYLELNNMA